MCRNNLSKNNMFKKSSLCQKKDEKENKNQAYPLAPARESVTLYGPMIMPILIGLDSGGPYLQLLSNFLN